MEIKAPTRLLAYSRTQGPKAPSYKKPWDKMSTPEKLKTLHDKFNLKSEELRQMDKAKAPDSYKRLQTEIQNLKERITKLR